eukprot:TRINITY_DN1713_c0_g1_i2.p1 TRINITY_DN1713_c0_g1~~TRINITY_DN1713_c0_g1_i2.p1  ORF type:complete len:1107 (+),score=342.11 TRINITY_DN1713_c0_g1_i2:84-3323(+)
MGSALVRQKQRECDELLEEIVGLCAQQGSALCRVRGAKHVASARIDSCQSYRWSLSRVGSSPVDLDSAAPVSPAPLGPLPHASRLSRPSSAATSRQTASPAKSGPESPVARGPRYPGALQYELQPTRDWGREWQELMDCPVKSFREQLQKLRSAEAFIGQFVDLFALQTVEELVRDLPPCMRRVSLGVTSPKKKSVGSRDVVELPATCQVPPLDLSRPKHASVTAYVLTTEEAAKQARQDFRIAMLAAASCLEGISVPLCVYLTCQGFGCALVAEPHLEPVGSFRGRRTLCARSAAAASALRSLCEGLNLKGSLLTDANTLWGPPDCAVHGGADGRSYAFELRDLLPHWPPPKGVGVRESSVLWVRPEAARSAAAAVSCGAFTTCGTAAHREDDAALRLHCRAVCQEGCPAAAASWAAAIAGAPGGVAQSQELAAALHQRGANVACAGLALAALPRSSAAWALCLGFCIGRALKAMLSATMREASLAVSAAAPGGRRRSERRGSERRTSNPHPVYSSAAVRVADFLRDAVLGSAEIWGPGALRHTLRRKFAAFPFADVGTAVDSPQALEAAPGCSGVLHLAVQLTLTHCGVTLDEELPPCVLGSSWLSPEELQRRSWVVASLGAQHKTYDLLAMSPLAEALVALDREGDEAAERVLRGLSAAAASRGGAATGIYRGALARHVMWDWETGRVSGRRAREAERLFKGAVEARQQQGDAPYEATVALGRLAAFYSEHRAWAKALDAAERMCVLREQLLGAQRPEYADALLAKGLCLGKAQKVQQAIEAINQALSIRQAVCGPLGPPLLQAYTQLASLYEDNAQADEAEPLRAKALAIRVNTLGRWHLAVSTSLNNLAVNLYHQQRFDEAEPLFRLDIEICERILGPEHEEVATSLNNLASLLTSQGRFDKAEPLYRRDLEISSKRLGRSHPHTATSLNNLAAAYAEQCRYEEALELYSECLRIRREHFGAEHPLVAETLNNIGALCVQTRDLEGAKQHYNEAISIIEGCEGAESQRLAAIYNNMQAVCEELEQADEAESWAEKAMDLKRMDTTICRAIRTIRENSGTFTPPLVSSATMTQIL